MMRYERPFQQLAGVSAAAGACQRAPCSLFLHREMGEWHSGFKNLLHFKAIEQIKTDHNVLSARNEYHRQVEQFQAEVSKTSSIITSQKANTRGVPKKKVKLEGRRRKNVPSNDDNNNDVNNSGDIPDGSPTKSVVSYDTNDTDTSTSSANNIKSSLFLPYFNRAIAKERLKDIDGAINDYSTCLQIDNKHGLSYFNRGGLFRANGDPDKALRDLRKAVEIDPSNHKFQPNHLMRSFSMLHEYYSKLKCYDSEYPDPDHLDIVVNVLKEESI